MCDPKGASLADKLCCFNAAAVSACAETKTRCRAHPPPLDSATVRVAAAAAQASATPPTAPLLTGGPQHRAILLVLLLDPTLQRAALVLLVGACWQMQVVVMARVVGWTLTRVRMCTGCPYKCCHVLTCV